MYKSIDVSRFDKVNHINLWNLFNNFFKPKLWQCMCLVSYGYFIETYCMNILIKYTYIEPSLPLSRCLLLFNKNIKSIGIVIRLHGKCKYGSCVWFPIYRHSNVSNRSNSPQSCNKLDKVRINIFFKRWQARGNYCIILNGWLREGISLGWWVGRGANFKHATSFFYDGRLKLLWEIVIHVASFNYLLPVPVRHSPYSTKCQ